MDVRERAFELGYNPDFYRRIIAKREREERLRAENLEKEQAEERARKAKELMEREADFIRLRQESRESLERILVERFQTTAKDVITLVAGKHGVRYEDIMSRNRVPAIALARQEAMAAVALAKPHLTTPQIGKIFDRDHTTVCHALKKMGITR